MVGWFRLVFSKEKLSWQMILYMWIYVYISFDGWRPMFQCKNYIGLPITGFPCLIFRNIQTKFPIILSVFCFLFFPREQWILRIPRNFPRTPGRILVLTKDLESEAQLGQLRDLLVPIRSMYGIFSCIYHKNQLNVSKYAIHGVNGSL